MVSHLDSIVKDQGTLLFSKMDQHEDELKNLIGWLCTSLGINMDVKVEVLSKKFQD